MESQSVAIVRRAIVSRAIVGGAIATGAIVRGAWKKVRVTAEKRSTGCANDVAPIEMTSEQ